MDADAQTQINLARQARTSGDRAASLKHFQNALASAPGQIPLKIEIASDLRELGRFDEAEVVLHEVLKQKPEHFGVLVGLGRTARKRGDRTTALGYFEAAAMADPNHLPVKMEIVSNLRELGRLDEAETILRTILEQQPSHFAALVALGHIVRRRGDRSASLTYFQAALAADPAQLPLKLQIATDLREFGRLEEAELVLQDVLQQKPNHFGAFLGLGHIARMRADQPAALGYFRAAAMADAPNANSRLGLASAFRNVAQLDIAEDICRQILAETPDDSKALTELGLIARRQGKRSEALALFRSAAEEHSRDARAYLELAVEFRDRGLYEEARQAIETAIRIEPLNVNALMHRGYLQRHVGNRMSARNEFCQISEQHPNFAAAFIELAVEERALGNLRGAEQILETIAKSNPDHLPALEQLAGCARLAGDFEKALRLYRHAIELHPASIWLYIHASQTLDDLGDHKAALEYLDTATSLFGKQPDIISKHADLLKRAGLTHDARQLVEAALKETPHSFKILSHCVQLDLLFGDFEVVDRKLQDFSTDLTSELSRVHLFRGQLAEARGKFEEAKSHYGLAAKLDPQDIKARAEMFRACLLTLETKEARNHLEAWTRLGAPAAIAQNRSHNVSQSGMGQIYDEFVLNKQLLNQLIEVHKLAAEERIAPLRSLLLLNPDHTPTAIQLIIALRHANLLELPYPTVISKVPSIVPKSIVQYWDAPNPPSEIRLLMQSWQDHNKDYTYELFDDDAAKHFLLKNYSADVLKAYNKAELPAEKADLFRLAYLYASGGIYVDADDRCHGPIGTVLPPQASLVVYQEDYALGGLAVGTLGNNFLAASPNNSVIGRALNLAIQAINRGDTDTVWLKTGPALITRAFAQIAAETPLNLSTWLKTIAVIERRELSQVAAFHCFSVYKATKHWSKHIK